MEKTEPWKCFPKIWEQILPVPSVIVCLKCHTPYSSDHVSGSPDRDIFSPSSRQRNKRICSGSELSSISPPAAASDSYAVDDSMARLCRSQPEPRLEQPSVPVASVAAAMLEEKVSFSFSQPAYLDDMLLNSQLHATQPSTQPSSQVLVCGVLTVSTFHFCNCITNTVIFFTEYFPETGATHDTLLRAYELWGNGCTIVQIAW